VQQTQPQQDETRPDAITRQQVEEVARVVVACVERQAVQEVAERDADQQR
jgi:hypothetical protein